MAKHRFYPPYRYISLAIQDFHVQRRFPKFESNLRSGLAIWRGDLQPYPISPVHKVEVQYKLKGIPHVRVLFPPLVEGAPHLYRDRSLCLYWLKEWMWRPDQLIALTIIPWTASWLYFYELWLDTGKWLGPTSHETVKQATGFFDTGIFHANSI